MQVAKRVAPAGRAADDHPLGAVVALAAAGAQAPGARLGERLDGAVAGLVLRRVEVAAQDGRRLVGERREMVVDGLERADLGVLRALGQRRVQADDVQRARPAGWLRLGHEQPLGPRRRRGPVDDGQRTAAGDEHAETVHARRAGLHRAGRHRVAGLLQPGPPAPERVGDDLLQAHDVRVVAEDAVGLLVQP
jgi:hypothetical protein